VDWKRVFDPQGLNWWTVLSGMGMNLILTAFLFLAVTAWTAQGASEVAYTLAMCAGAFVIPLASAYACGRLSDERFLTYGLYSLVGFLILAVPGIVFAPMFGLLTIGFGVLGAVNGATLAARRAMKRRRAILELEEQED
jgi:hypothetical protein